MQCFSLYSGGRGEEEGEFKKTDYFRDLAILVKSSFALNSPLSRKAGNLACPFLGHRRYHSSLSDVLLSPEEKETFTGVTVPTTLQGMMSTIRLSSRRNREWGSITITWRLGFWLFPVSDQVPSNISVYKWCSRPAWAVDSGVTQACQNMAQIQRTMEASS